MKESGSISVFCTISYCFQLAEGVIVHPLISIDWDVGLYNSTNSAPFAGLISTSLITIEIESGELCDKTGVIVPVNKITAIRPNRRGLFKCICYSNIPFLLIIESNWEKVDPFVKVLCVFEYNTNN